MKIIKYLLLLILLTSCSFSDYEYEDGRENELQNKITISNLFTEVELHETKKNINITNISNFVIIEISYSLNGDIYNIYESLVPGESIILINDIDRTRDNMIEIINMTIY